MGLNSPIQHFFVTEVKELDLCGKKGYQFIGSAYSLPTDFRRLHYEVHNLNTCKQCQQTHTSVLKIISDKFQKFPLCCDMHHGLIKQTWFKRKDFESTPNLYADKLMYTYHHILNYIDKENWKEEVFDFIEYILNTFGSFPINYGEPLYFSSFIGHLSELVKESKIELEKSREILDFIETFLHDEKGDKSDFNIALECYNEWFRTFPFELSLFTPLREYFANNIPVLETIHVNKYLGMAKARPASKESLVNTLLNITDAIISRINLAVVYEEGLLSDIDKSETELILQQRRQKLKEGYLNKSRDPEDRYRKVLKEWLRDELKFIKAIRPLFERASVRAISLQDRLIIACQKMQESMIFKNADENTRTRQILDLLSLEYFTKDQSLYGQSGSGIKQGEVDGVVIDKDQTEYFIEAFNLNSLDKQKISHHIHKLELNYDSKGLLRKYILVYFNVADNKFDNLFSRYYEFLKTSLQFKFAPKGFEEFDTKYTNIRVVKSTHEREGRGVELVHVAIKMPID